MLWTHLLPRFARLGMLLAVTAPLAFAEPVLSLRVGMGLAKPPYILESGEAGLEVEIAEQAFAAAGYKMNGLQFPPARALAMQRAGQLDALLSVDEGIGGKDFFSEPYITYHNAAITLSQRNIRLKNVETWPGIRWQRFRMPASSWASASRPWQNGTPNTGNTHSRSSRTTCCSLAMWMWWWVTV